MSKPKAAPGLDVVESDDGLIIYDKTSDSVHHLNQTASIVFLLCDGTRDVDEIGKVVASEFELASVPQHEIAECIDSLEHQLLIWHHTDRAE